MRTPKKVTYLFIFSWLANRFLLLSTRSSYWISRGRTHKIAKNQQNAKKIIKNNCQLSKKKSLPSSVYPPNSQEAPDSHSLTTVICYKAKNWCDTDPCKFDLPELRKFVETRHYEFSSIFFRLGSADWIRNLDESLKRKS